MQARFGTRCRSRGFYSKACRNRVQASPQKANWHLGNTRPEGQLTRLRAGPHDGRMNEALYTTSRRSLRVFHKVKLQAQGRSHDGRKFREICETLVVNAHGALLMMRHEVNNSEILVLVNPLTQEEQECRIVFLGENGERGQRVGVEFLTPAPHFWGIDFEGRALPLSGENGETN